MKKSLALIFDTETTGLIHHPSTKDELQPQIIEFGAVLVTRPKGDVNEELNLLINPGKPIPEIITNITGITDADVAPCGRFADVVKEIRGMFAKADLLIAHNMPFDAGMMELELARLGINDWPWPKYRMCTVQEHTEEWGRRPKLTELYAHYTGRPLDQTHRAIEDVMALRRVCILGGLL